ncbi:MAG TPA: hypothetical protein VJZ71_09550 [Phycisphaerae bacterium]|nr:hypothetical protein [Phycisphaerae bacterium]
MEILIGSLALVLLVSIGLNFLLNFDSMVQWLPADVLLWMDDGKGNASADLIRRLRDGKLSDRQLAKLVSQRISDPRLVLRSPFPVGHEQVVHIEQNCRMPLDKLSVEMADWRVLVDGAEVFNSTSHVNLKTEDKVTKSRKKKTPRFGEGQRAQTVTLMPLEAGSHSIQLTGDMTVFRSKENREIVYCRPVSVNRNLEISGDLADYAKPRTDSQLLELMRNGCVAYSWWAGKEEDEYRNYRLSLWAASPGIPFIATVWVRVGSTGDFTKVGLFTNRGSTSTISWGDQYSLVDVPGISDARRIQVRLTPDLATAFKNGHREFFAVIIEWDSVPVRHRRVGQCPNPATDEYRLPSRVRKSNNKKNESPASEGDEEI